MEFLPRPEMLHREVDCSAALPLTVMTLRWNTDAPGAAERTWHLPEHVCVKGTAPERFGIAIQPEADDTYRVQLVWNDLRLEWRRLAASQIMTGSLSQILRALGNDLWHMLHQPQLTARAA